MLSSATNEVSTVKIWTRIILGLVIITVPVVIILVILPILCFSYPPFGNQLVGVAGAVFLFISGNFIAWYYWGWMIVKWKVYAYSSLDMDSWGELYELSLKVLLSWPIGSPNSVYERWSEDDLPLRAEIISQVMDHLEFKKLKHDFALENKVVYALSKRDPAISLACLCLAMAVFVFVAISLESIYFLLVMVALVFLLSWREVLKYKVLLIKEGQLELTNEYLSVQLNDTSIYYWLQVENIEMKYYHDSYVLEITQDDHLELIKLAYFKIKDHDVLWQQIELFIDRAYGGYDFGEEGE